MAEQTFGITADQSARIAAKLAETDARGTPQFRASPPGRYVPRQIVGQLTATVTSSSTGVSVDNVYAVLGPNPTTSTTGSLELVNVHGISGSEDDWIRGQFTVSSTKQQWEAMGGGRGVGSTPKYAKAQSGFSNAAGSARRAVAADPCDKVGNVSTGTTAITLQTPIFPQHDTSIFADDVLLYQLDSDGDNTILSQCMDDPIGTVKDWIGSTGDIRKGWTKFASGKFFVGLSTGTTHFKTLGSTGGLGSVDHAHGIHSANDIGNHSIPDHPAHRHQLDDATAQFFLNPTTSSTGSYYYINGCPSYTDNATSTGFQHSTTGLAHSALSHTTSLNLPPYEVVHHIKRTS